MRKTQQAIAALCLINSASAFALGVGDITTHSALNQVLNAKIPLISSKSEDPSDINIALASRENFKQAGIDRPQYLSDLKFTPVVGADGEITINVTSSSSIKEPFVNFILEVEWPQGRTLKEFTILLDPPITMADVTTAPIELAKSTVMESIPAPASTNTTVTNTSPVAQPSSKASYGPTASNDTVWGIAKRLLTTNNSATHQQMMMALYENNPKAFYKKNINALMKGQVLSVPSSDVINQLSAEQARNAYSNQLAQWSSSATAKKSSNNASASSNISLDEPTDAKLTLLTPDEPAQNKTSNNSTTNDTSTELGADNNAIAQANMALEMATTNEQKSKEVQNRLDELETQVEKLQRLIALKDSQLAQLQTEPADIETAEPVKSKQPAAASAPAVTADVEESQWPLYAGGGLLVALFGLFLARRKSKDDDQPFPVDIDQPAEKDLFEDNTTSFVDDIEEQIVVEETEIESDSLLSEFTPSEFENLDDAQEADPLTECDVYIAYGRYQQAEDLIQKAISEDPTNQAFTLKLLDVYFSSDNAESFENLAKELTSLKETDPDVWVGIANMGAELCSGSTVFGAPQQGVNDDAEEPTLEDELQESTIEEPATFDFPETIEDELFAEEAITADVPSEPSTDETDKGDFEFDFDLVTPEADSSTQDEPVDLKSEGDAFNLADSEFGDSSENIADTKLSLAEAYIDMLDLESAKEALDEVIEIGDIEQVASAKKLLDKL